MKLCKDCLHYIYREPPNPAQCDAESQPVFDLVHGEKPRCATARLDPSNLSRLGITPNLQNCGPEGKWFEPKGSEETALWRR